MRRATDLPASAYQKCDLLQSFLPHINVNAFWLMLAQTALSNLPAEFHFIGGNTSTPISYCLLWLWQEQSLISGSWSLCSVTIFKTSLSIKREKLWDYFLQLPYEIVHCGSLCLQQKDESVFLTIWNWQKFSLLAQMKYTFKHTPTPTHTHTHTHTDPKRGKEGGESTNQDHCRCGPNGTRAPRAKGVDRTDMWIWKGTF